VTRAAATRELRPQRVASTRLQELAPDEQLRYFAARAGLAGRMLPDLEPARVRHFLRLFAVDCEAMMRRAPRPYAGPAVFFRASEADGHDSTTPERGCLELGQHGVDVHPAPGNQTLLDCCRSASRTKPTIV
jgi:hypothetical protein